MAPLPLSELVRSGSLLYPPAGGLSVSFSNLQHATARVVAWSGRSHERLYMLKFPAADTWGSAKTLHDIARGANGANKVLCIGEHPFLGGSILFRFASLSEDAPLALFDKYGVLATPGFSGKVRIISVRDYALADSRPHKHQRLRLQPGAADLDCYTPTPCQFPAASSW